MNEFPIMSAILGVFLVLDGLALAALLGIALCKDGRPEQASTKKSFRPHEEGRPI
jgi:hypothetical protein